MSRTPAPDKDTPLRDVDRRRLSFVDDIPNSSNDLLGAIWFGENGRTTGLPCLQVAMPLLAGNAPGEIWRGEPSLAGQYAGIRYRADDDMLFGVLQLDEGDFTEQGPSALQQAGETAYARLFALLRQTGYPHLWRTWNYVARINAEEMVQGAPLERYRQFNIGRQTAFDHYERPADTTAPAACGLGMRDGSLNLGFVAGRTPPTLIENPRQVSAYHYPDDYGPRSPTFSRAALARAGDQTILFVSGTASIIGHRSVHLDDVRAQTRETLNNIAALVDEAANKRPDLAPLSLADLHYRIYVRRPDDLDAIRDEIDRRIGNETDACYVQADICRQELLVEIEATGQWPESLAERTT